MSDTLQQFRLLDLPDEQVYLSFINREAGHHSVAIAYRAARRRESELRADEDGFIYASLAGFKTRAILSGSENGNDFLRYWVRQTRTGLDEINFSAEERSQFLAITLRGMDEAVKLFQYGTRLAEFGFYDDARVLLDEYFRIYPSSQVLNNLGYVNLQLARLAMPVELSAQYWFAFAIDEQSGVPDVSCSLSSALPDDAKSYLMKAVTFLSESIAQSGQYDSAVKNLAIAHLYLKEHAKARAVLEPAIAVSDDQQLLTLMAIAVLLGSHVAEPWQAQHRDELLLRASRLDASRELLYNTASLLQRTGFESQSASFWQRLGLIFDQLPKLYQKASCLTRKYMALISDSICLMKVCNISKPCWLSVRPIRLACCTAARTGRLRCVTRKSWKCGLRIQLRQSNKRGLDNRDNGTSRVSWGKSCQLINSDPMTGESRRRNVNPRVVIAGAFGDVSFQIGTDQ